MNIFTKTTVALACCLPMTSFAAVAAISPYQQKALNQLKLINDCAVVAMQKVADELAQDGVVTGNSDMTTLTNATKMCNGVMTTIGYAATTGVVTVQVGTAAPVIPAFYGDNSGTTTGDLYTFTPLDKGGAALSASSTSISQWNCSYLAYNTDSNAAAFKAYGATASNLLKANPEAAAAIAMCSTS